MQVRERAPAHRHAAATLLDHSRLVLAQIVGVIEAVGLRVGVVDGDFGEGGLGQNLLGDVLDRAVQDFVNEADIAVFARGDPRDHLAPGHLGIDHGLAPAAAVVDHDDEILHGACNISENQKKVKRGLLPNPEIVRYRSVTGLSGFRPCGPGPRPWPATVRSGRAAG